MVDELDDSVKIPQTRPRRRRQQKKTDVSRLVNNNMKNHLSRFHFSLDCIQFLYQQTRIKSLSIQKKNKLCLCVELLWR